MTLILLLVAAILALALFLYLELEEMAAGTAIGVVCLSAVGVWLQLAATLAIFGLLAVALAIGAGVVLYRHFHSRVPGASPEKPSPDR